MAEREVITVAGCVSGELGAMRGRGGSWAVGQAKCLTSGVPVCAGEGLVSLKVGGRR